MTATATKKIIGKLSFGQGVHPPDRKELSAGRAVEVIRAAGGSEVVVPLSQHIGAPCTATVGPKQEVKAGQEVGRSEAFVSAPVHSPANGVVKEVAPRPHPSGVKALSVVIVVAEEQPEEQSWRELPEGFDPARWEGPAILEAIRRAGIVGQGGAAFPTAVKLTPNAKKPVDTVILNGCECEPYLTSDQRLMAEAPGPMAAGLELAMRAAGAERGIIAIEDNKPEAINSVLEVVKDRPGIQLAICQTKYPQGGERQLVKAVLGRVAPTGGLPLDVGAAVVNAGTASAVAWACAAGRACTERIVAVSGEGVSKPGNYRVWVGMLVGDLLERCGGLTAAATKVLLGGPMTGPSTGRLDVPIVKGSSGITVLSRGESRDGREEGCIRCSRCVDACPVRLMPTRIAQAVKARNLESARQYDLMACIECGCCAYVCPSKIPLVQYVRTGKMMERMMKQG